MTAKTNLHRLIVLPCQRVTRPFSLEEFVHGEPVQPKREFFFNARHKEREEIDARGLERVFTEPPRNTKIYNARGKRAAVENAFPGPALRNTREFSLV